MHDVSGRRRSPKLTRSPHTMFRLRFSLGLLTLAVFSGCVGYAPKPLTADATRAQLESRTLKDDGLARYLKTHGQTEGEEWDLSRLTLAGLYFSPALDVARAQLREAEAEVRSAEARPNPTLSFAPTYVREAPAGMTPWILGYALDVSIETAGKRTYRTREASHRVEVARLRVAEDAWVVRSAVRRALIELHAAEAAVELWRAQKPLLADSARLVDSQVSAGEVSPLLASQARIAVNRAELARRESERTLIAARIQLAQVIGIPAAAMTDVRLSFRGLSEAPEQWGDVEAKTWAAQNRSDLLAELSAYAATEAALEKEVARQYPDLSLKPGYDLDQGTGKWALGLGFTLPVFHQNQGPIAVATARREVAAARFVAMQNRVLAEVDRASVDYSSALGDLETVKALRESLERQTKTVKAQQEAGETSRLELVRAQIELADIARLDVDARARVARAISAFEDAVQRPLAWPEAAWRTDPRTR